MKVWQYLKVSDNEADSKDILWICFMFFLWGSASSMIFTLLPLFIVEELGGNYQSFGLIEGGVVTVSFLSKLFVGLLIDLLKKTKPILCCGAFLTVLSKISLACSWNIAFVFVAKACDRFAKGLRSAPCDAVLARLATRYGSAYSLKYMMNVAGSLTGSLLTAGILLMVGNNYKLIFSLAVIPTILAFCILKKKIKYEETDEVYAITKKHFNNLPTLLKEVLTLPKAYWRFLIFVAILMFARFSEGFITLLAKKVMPEKVASFPIFMAMYEICAVCVSIFIGRLADQVNKKWILFYGILWLLLTDFVAIFAHNSFMILWVYIGAGVHMGATHGILSSVIAQHASKAMIGSAFAIYYAVDGVCIFLSNYFAGLSSHLASCFGLQEASGPFLQGALACFVACVYICFFLKKE